MATNQVDATLLVEEEGGARRPLSVDDLAATRTGAAKESSLQDLLTELGQKLEPADVAALATATRQDAAKNVLDAISQAVGAPTTETLLSLLASIKANTGTETTTVQELELTAEQVQLNTDTLEELLAGKLQVRQVGVAPPLGYAQASVTAVQALPTVPANTVTALVVPRAPVRWRDDGTNPTASAGMYLAADQPLEYRGNLAAFRMVSVSGAAEVNVSFYGAEA